MKFPLPADAVERQRSFVKPTDAISIPDNVFDFAGFIEVLLVEHGRDLGLSLIALEEYRNTILPAIQVPGQILNTALAARLVKDLRQRGKL